MSWLRNRGNLADMNRLALLFIAFVGVSACAPLTSYHQQGVSAARMQNDLLDCQVSALEQAPVANQVRRSAPRYVPGFRRCNSDGRCYNTGGYFYPGEVYTVDVNALLRRDLLTRCMAQQGYSRVELPRCPQGTTLPPLGPAAQSMGPLSPDSCIVKTTDGRSLIIDPAG
ncbi:MAG: hypothetical protein V2I76_11370 [Roseobacter sp.]|nr:hypothetical protein [Roseobacter sp.]